MYLCTTVLDDNGQTFEMTTPVIAIVSPHDKTGRRLATQMHYVDEKKRCFSTDGLWMNEEETTSIEFAWDGRDAKGQAISPFSVTIEVDIS